MTPQNKSSKFLSPTLFLLFFLSGFCGLLYQIIWLRKAFAFFGVITPVLSIVLSTFMLGLSVGSWIGGLWGGKWRRQTGLSPILLYGITELLIGVGGLLVPYLFSWGAASILFLGESNSTRYLLMSALIISISILPWCVFMGMTFPLMMAFMKETLEGSDSSFSFLYLANVIGAMAGVGLTAIVLIELFGFQACLLSAVATNMTIAFISFILAVKYHHSHLLLDMGSLVAGDSLKSESKDGFFLNAVLFMTGFCAMALEVIWTRAFTPILETTIYAFAFLLVLYLFGTWSGSLFYRRRRARGKIFTIASLLGFAFITSILALPLTDPRLNIRISGIFFSIVPFCAILGCLTPQLIDRYSEGSPSKAGNAYAINIIGCILGPLLAGYIFLPYFGVKWSILILAIPFLGFFMYTVKRISSPKFFWIPTIAAGLLVFAGSALFSVTYEEPSIYENAEVRRDHTATIISTGSGMHKKLLVNGIGITKLTPVTKVMAHFPLACLEKKPRSAIVLCFGMGTTYRSLMSWGIDVTAVELVPSVVNAFGYYFDDASVLMQKQGSHIVVDDARRYLQRTQKKYDLVTVDPPPPIAAAGSSLLYSVEFYELVKKRLEPGGILQQWCPTNKGYDLTAVARSLTMSFAYVYAFASLEDWGYHFLASMEPITFPSIETLLSRMPTSAQADLMEWFRDPRIKIQDIMYNILIRATSLASILDLNPSSYISDDRPYNEYYQIRQITADKNSIIGRWFQDGK